VGLGGLKKVFKGRHHATRGGADGKTRLKVRILPWECLRNRFLHQNQWGGKTTASKKDC